MQMYQVIDSSGQAFGPASLELLRQWAAESRLTPEMVVVDLETARQGQAREMLAGLVVFVNTAPVDPPVTPAEPAQVPSYSYQGNDEPGHSPTLRNRAAAFLIDLLLGTSLYLALRFGLVYLLLPRAETGSWTMLGYVDYLFIPLTAAYFLLRDSIYPAQSIGKRISRIKVLSTNGKPLTPMQSALRNIAAAPMILLPIPILGYLALSVLILAAFGEILMVMTQGKRFGDTLANTKVVNE